MQKKFNEGLEYGDLRRSVIPEVTIDTFKSKMGDDKDICTIALLCKEKNPAIDLMAFLEKSYDWLLDAEVSAGERDDGKYLVFIEADRNKELPTHIHQMLEDLLNLTEDKIEDWKFRYYRSKVYHDVTVENLAREIPLTPREYSKEHPSKKDTKRKSELKQLQAVANVPIKAERTEDKDLQELQSAAGII
jgi:hypothetical protein